MCGLISDLVICKFRQSMVIHDTKCPYWDQVSLNNTHQFLWAVFQDGFKWTCRTFLLHCLHRGNWYVVSIVSSVANYSVLPGMRRHGSKGNLNRKHVLVSKKIYWAETCWPVSSDACCVWWFHCLCVLLGLVVYFVCLVCRVSGLWGGVLHVVVAVVMCYFTSMVSSSHMSWDMLACKLMLGASHGCIANTLACSDGHSCCVVVVVVAMA